VFSVTRRDQLRRHLIERAEDDDRIVAAAVTGSRAEGREDRWSDIDLYFGVRDGVPLDAVVEDWSAHLHAHLGAVHHFRLSSGPAVYRAFILDDGLQVDLGFVPAAAFGPVGEGAFDVVFGSAGPRRPMPPDEDYLVGMVWHHVLHARAAVERGALWRAEYWLTSLRDVVVTLASIRHGLPHSHARGADALPGEITAAMERTLVRELTPPELSRALKAATELALQELSFVAPDVADPLRAVLIEPATGA
jgi:hypothetical protein